MNIDDVFAPEPDIHRRYLPTKCFAGAALHILHWRLVGMLNRVDVQYRLNIRKLIDEPLKGEE